MKQAIATRRHNIHQIFHSQRGKQYGSRCLPRHGGMRQSMSARANPYNNFWTQSFVDTLKSELLQIGRFINPSDTRAEIFALINGNYSTQRLYPFSTTEHPTTPKPKSLL